VLVRRQGGIGLLCLPAQRSFDAAQLAVGREGQLASAAPLEELIEGELQEGQGSCLSLHLKEQVAHQIALKGQLHVGQRSGLLDHLT
jgi:hypothetical protein